jgi:hydrogenase maturation protease
MILIIGYGNSLRRDDGAGLALAERLEQLCRTRRQLAVERLTSHQLTPEMALEIARPEVTAVVFVDTRVAASGETELALRVEPLSAAEASPSVGHHLSPTALLAYASQLYGHAPPAWQVTIPGLDFDHGEGLSSPVEQLLDDAPQALAGLLDQLEVTENPR